jgi:tRNA-(ms[2]io[6]A)-hydroxylase
MSLVAEKLPLRAQTPQGWIEAVEADFDRFLVDHAACERKASALAMSFVVKFSNRKSLIEPMICLAKEELAHYHEVYRLMAQRGCHFSNDEKDPYVQKMLNCVRHGRDEHFLDRLLVSGIIEARGCERFHLLGQNLADETLAQFYSRLGREEAGHYMIFLRIARNYFEESEIRQRLAWLLDQEAEIMLSIPFRPAVH